MFCPPRISHMLEFQHHRGRHSQHNQSRRLSQHCTGSPQQRSVQPAPNARAVSANTSTAIAVQTRRRQLKWPPIHVLVAVEGACVVSTHADPPTTRHMGHVTLATRASTYPVHASASFVSSTFELLWRWCALKSSNAWFARQLRTSWIILNTAYRRTQTPTYSAWPTVNIRKSGHLQCRLPARPLSQSLGNSCGCISANAMSACRKTARL